MGFHVAPRRPHSSHAAERAQLDVVVVDPQPAMRLGVQTLLEGSGAVSVVGEATTPLTALELAETLGPAVIVIDPGQHGVSDYLMAWDRLREIPPSTVAYLSEASQAPAAAFAGIDSCLHKRTDPALLHEVVLRTVDGERLWMPTNEAQATDFDIAGKTIERRTWEGSPTSRERQVLALLLECCSDAEIAKRP